MLEEFQLQGQCADAQIEIGAVDFDDRGAPDVGHDAVVGGLNLIGCDHGGLGFVDGP